MYIKTKLTRGLLIKTNPFKATILIGLSSLLTLSSNLNLNSPISLVFSISQKQITNLKHRKTLSVRLANHLLKTSNLVLANSFKPKSL